MSPETAGRSLSIIIPAKNEQDAIGDVVRTARAEFPEAEILVVNDGSTDDTAAVAEQAGATVISHPLSLGNGASIKTGARAASGETLVMLDGDGQHDPKYVRELLHGLDNGYDMVVGARDSGSHANIGRLFANGLYNAIATFLSGTKILDLTSGFRAVRAKKFLEYLYLLPNGFSYPTTITMAFLRSGYPVHFEPVAAVKRTGKSHIRPLRDGLRFFAIIFKIATLYAPLKIFLPVSGLFFLTGLSWYAYTFLTMHRFTNLSMLMLSASVIVFLIGLISEQITSLLYKKD